MKNDQRKQLYLSRTGRSELTPRQRRRMRKKARQGKEPARPAEQ